MKSNLRTYLAMLLIVAMLAVPVFSDTGANDITEKIDAIIQVIHENYYKDVNTADLLDGALKGIFGALDRHSVYFTEEDYKAFNSDISGDFGGLGIYIESKDNKITVISPIEGTPAYRAGIKSGDRIIKVDDKSIIGYTTEEAAALMKGAPGTKVKIGIEREGVKDIIYMTLTRELIQINPIKYEIKKDNIGYIRISEFNSHTTANFKKAVNEFKSKNVKGVIIDLRDNPGGLLGEVVEICRTIIPKGPIVHLDYKNDEDITYSSDLEKAPFKIAVLVNGGSASASEIMAGAVKDSGAGILIGENTYGKGTVQNIFEFNDGTALKITTARYLTPKKFALDGMGLKPDIEIKALPEIDKEYAPIKGDRVMKQGIIGLDVLGLQQRLKKLGFIIKDGDGIFGKSTYEAVVKFQKDNKLKATGQADSAFVKLLERKFMDKITSQDMQLERAITEIKKMVK